MSVNERPDWDDWALGIAQAVAARADCRRRKVGAVILDMRNRVVSTGYNGANGKQRGCLAGGCPRGLQSLEQVPSGSPYDEAGPGFCIATHAEMNALLQADPLRLTSATLYCNTSVCRWCLKVIANTDIRRIVQLNSRGHKEVRLV